MEFVRSPSATRTLMPQGVALLATVKDAAGMFFSLESCSISYGRDASGNITTETATDGTNSWVKTYTWTSGVLSAESKWEKQ